MADKTIVTASAANREARGRYLGDLARRENASGILNPGEVAGEYDGGRLLQTTLGGQLRPMTTEDLRVFRESVKKLGKRFKGGITAKSVIDLSAAIDRERANTEIRTAVPMQSIGGRMHFVTNAGPKRDVTRHHVHIELLNFSAAVSSPAKVPGVAKLLTAGPLRYDCDCGRHTFWFRFITTAGNFNSGRRETGFPKIRNPRLVGVACKHVLRVMQQLASPVVRTQVEKMIERGRMSLDNKPLVMTKKAAQELAAQQKAQAGWKRNKVETGAERRTRLLLAAKAKKVAVLAVKNISTKTKAAAITEFQRMAREMVAKGFYTARQVADILSKLR